MRPWNSRRPLRSLSVMCVSPGPDSHPNLLTASLYILPFVHVLIVGTLAIIIFHCVAPKLFDQPTKDRAKKPHKVKDMQATIKEQDNTSAVKLIRNHSPATAKIRTISIRKVEATELQPSHMPPAVEFSITSHPSFASRRPEMTEEPTSAISYSPPERAKRISRIGRTLPGLTTQRRVAESIPIATSPKSPSSLHKLREDMVHAQPMHAAVRHPRAAESRPTVMDVAFAFGQQTGNDTADIQSFNTATIIASESKAEKRKSALDKYTSMMLPALKEEATPSGSPIGTLSRAIIPSDATHVDNVMIGKKPADSSGPPTVNLVHLSTARK